MSANVVGQLKSQKEIEWEIADFQSLSAEVDQRHESPVFSFCDSSWYLQLYPNGEKWRSSAGYVGLFLVRGDSGPRVSVIYSLFLKKTDGRETISSEEKDTFEGKDTGWGEPKAIARSRLMEQKSQFFPSGTLTVICSLKWEQEPGLGGTLTEDAAAQTTVCGNLPSATNALRDYEKILLSEDGCDVTLQVKGKTFEAHRTVLRARSSVFASMLRHDMKENSTGMIDIEDCEPETFPDFLRFLYCGDDEVLTSQNACSLYRAADKYDVQDLKSECLNFIKAHLDLDNFCDIVTLALLHGEADLLRCATDFFARNMLEIVKSVKWQVFHAENPTESNELLIKGLSAVKS